MKFKNIKKAKKCNRGKSKVGGCQMIVRTIEEIEGVWAEPARYPNNSKTQ